jgi:2,3-bisphosphoglycerate-dependent phosphoglycerate mutase
VALAAWVGRKRFELGDAAFLKAWFSTVFVRLEAGNWGSLYPTIMRDFYSGTLSNAKLDAASEELGKIREKLAALPPDQVVWDFEDRATKPPWGDSISPHIDSLGNYFVTSDGRDLFAVFHEALAAAQQEGLDVNIG